MFGKPIRKCIAGTITLHSDGGYVFKQCTANGVDDGTLTMCQAHHTLMDVGVQLPVWSDQINEVVYIGGI